jgi:nucleoid-associated protein YgaU
MNRYGNTKRKLNKSGQRVYATTYYPEIPLHDSDTLFQVRTGDRIDNLAFTFYEDSSLWWIIAKANGIRGKVALESGTVIRIPGNVTKVINDFQKINK